MKIYCSYPRARYVSDEYVIAKANDHQDSENPRGAEGGGFGYRPIKDRVQAQEYCENEGIATFAGPWID